MSHGRIRAAQEPEISGSTGLLPVLGDHPILLILGSFPSCLSLTQGEYYGNPQNQFWRIMEDLFSIPVTLPYAERIRQLERCHIALWDVVNSCTRTGSSDAKIRDPVFNDIPGLLKRYPTIRIIVCNGTTARRYVGQMKCIPVASIHTLPATSPANATVTIREKIERWRMVCCQ
ncbi:MAG: Hypoxanthine DNA glycosylase [Methanoregula sp. SKADARSKE-2]|nr:MAG: Hypoxanthine DNA glycosylase [Methanoregula sp. SKADARSKE-2]